jgi:carbon monoxide dehydrogenase subunit G
VIDTEQSIVIDAAIESVWDYVKDIRRWAELMPGCRSCEIIDAHDSRWVIKVGVGGLVRTVNVRVHIERWDGPGRVDFGYTLEGDPVVGGGSYVARRKSALATEVTMSVRVAGSGPLAPLWEAMSRPLLPQLVKSFAGQLKAAIETAAGVPQLPGTVGTRVTPRFAVIVKWLANRWRAIVR